jgi:hypothetical protein
MWWMIIVGAIVALGGLAALEDNVLGGLVGLLIGLGLVYLGWKGKTRLLISQMGGEKYYAVRGKDQKLIDFMDAVNGRLA